MLRLAQAAAGDRDVADWIGDAVRLVHSMSSMGVTIDVTPRDTTDLRMSRASRASRALRDIVTSEAAKPPLTPAERKRAERARKAGKP